MSWNKNKFGYIMWFFYTLLAGAVLVGLGCGFSVRAGFTVYWGILFAGLYAALAGGTVLLLRRAAPAILAFGESKRGMLLVLEAVLTTVFLAAGLALRIYGAGEAVPSWEYYDLAEVAPGRQIPQLAHGAEYFYVGILHGAFLLLGNQYIVGLWLQIVLQLLASAALYFAVRMLSGSVAALTAWGFWMLSPYMVQSSLMLSPLQLYFLVLAAAAALLLPGFCGRFSPTAFLFMGVLTAGCCYMDITGLLLLFPVLAAACGEREENVSKGRRAAAVLLAFGGIVLGLGIFFCTDALFSGKSIGGVAQAWFALYRPESFRLPVAVGYVGSEAEGYALAGLMTLGIFSFWCGRKREYMAGYTAAAWGVVLAGCFGIFTEEVPGFYFLYLLFALMAGVSIRQCLPGSPETEPLAQEQPENKQEAETELKERGASGENAPKETWAEDEALEREKELKEEFRREREGDGSGEDGVLQESPQKQVCFLENPLPLPKRHQKRVMNYALEEAPEEDDFDYPVSEGDDFDF